MDKVGIFSTGNVGAAVAFGAGFFCCGFGEAFFCVGLLGALLWGGLNAIAGFGSGIDGRGIESFGASVFGGGGFFSTTAAGLGDVTSALIVERVSAGLSSSPAILGNVREVLGRP